jgi:hypothetical protein
MRLVYFLMFSNFSLCALIMLQSLSQLIRRWRVVLLLVAVFALTQGRASAECGDYITIRHDSTVVTGVESMPASDQITPHDFNHSTPTKLPCNGPNCSRSPVRGLPPLAPVGTVSHFEKEMVQNLRLLDDATAHLTFSRDSNSSLPVSRATSVFHPPRQS